MIRSVDTSQLLQDVLLDHGVLFDGLVPVSSKQQDREEVVRTLGICISCGRGGSNNLSRAVSLRITDPSDPFVLFTMELLEDDYGAFKQRLELLVDFAGFPKYLVTMFNNVAHGGGGTQQLVSFVVDSKNVNHGVLRILERTDFRSVEHISLEMNKQGDVGQKRYLAEKFQFFEASFIRSESDRANETRNLQLRVSDLKEELDVVKKERDEAKERLRVEATVAESGQLSAVSKLKDEHAKEWKRVQQQNEAERSALQARLESSAHQAAQESKHKDAENAVLRNQLNTLESSESSLKSQLRIALDNAKNKSLENDHLRETNNELAAFRTSTTRSMSEKELTHVQTVERLRSATENLRGKEDELKTMRSQYEKQDNYLRILNDQYQQAAKKNDVSDGSLQKAHHIIANQLQTIRTLKEKMTALSTQVQTTNALVGERNNTVERLRGDQQVSNERVDLLQRKVADLKEQVQKLEEGNSSITTQLKQSQDALIHMQRHASVGGRHWSTTTTATTAMPDVYREFSRNSTDAPAMGLHSMVPPQQRPYTAGSSENAVPAAAASMRFASSSSAGVQPLSANYSTPNAMTFGKSSNFDNIKAVPQGSIQPVSAYFPTN